VRDVLLSLRKQNRLRMCAFWLAPAPEPHVRYHEPNRAASAKSQVSNSDQAISSQAPVYALAALNENDDPLQGCADCLACHQFAARGHASDAHICWKKGMKGGQVRSEQKRRERCAALVAAAEPPATVRLLACPSP
jgi:hypothetical protein